MCVQSFVVALKLIIEKKKTKTTHVLATED